MSQFPDLDILKDIPGYQAILKAVLKSQIQLLVEQLSKQTGEESVILTASVTDGTLCHLGSDSGKVFIDDHEEFRTQFLGFCLKRHHKRKANEISNIMSGFDPGTSSSSKRRKTPEPYPTSTPLHPASLAKVSPSRNIAGQRRPPSHTETQPANTSFAQDQSLFHSTDSFQGNVDVKHEEGAGDTSADGMTGDLGAPQTSEFESEEPGSEGVSGDGTIIKTEPSDDGLEITGVESGLSESGQQQAGYDMSQWPSGSEGMGFSGGAEGGDQSFSNNYDKYGCLLNSKSCELCGETFSKEEELRRHWITHTDVDKLSVRSRNTCEICGKTFTRAGDMRRHWITHTGWKHYECDICKKNFTRRDILKRHKIKKHSGQEADEDKAKMLLFKYDNQ